MKAIASSPVPMMRLSLVENVEVRGDLSVTPRADGLDQRELPAEYLHIGEKDAWRIPEIALAIDLAAFTGW